MPDSTPHKRLWFSPHGTSWTAESYEEALEMERDSLHEEYNRLVEQLAASQREVENLRDELRHYAGPKVEANVRRA